MSETGSHEQFSGRDTVKYATAYQQFAEAAATWGVPVEDILNSYQFKAPAAGEEMALVIFPEQPAVDLPLLSVSIDHPSRRLRRALDDVRPDIVLNQKRISFTLFEPNAAANIQGNHGIECHISNGAVEGPATTYSLTYAEFEMLIEQGGLCQKASVPQRLGRWAIRQLEGWAATEAAVHGNQGYRSGYDRYM